MKSGLLLQVLAVVLTQLSVGSLIMTSLLPTREIRSSFFTFNSLLAAIAAGIALVLTKTTVYGAWWDVRYLGLTVIGATAAFGCFRLERLELGRLLVVASAVLGLLFGLLPLQTESLHARGIHTTAPFFFDASVIAGALLLGATTVGMILGHWYLLMRRLSFEYLHRFAQILLGAVGLRIILVVLTLAVLKDYDAKLAGDLIPRLWAPGGNLFFFLMRILWGLALPLVLAFLVLRCVQHKANQAATGMLYVMEISVLFGELFAAYLLV